jgi:facilitated trehalose transporter
MLGFIISSCLMDWWGRKLSHAVVLLPGVCGWLLIYFAQDITTLMIGRILGGVTAGATVTLGAIVIGEYTSPKLRGVFLNMKTTSVCVGNTLIHILGHYYHWRTVAMSALVPYILALFIIFTWPESPAWLASKKQFEKSQQAFFYLRGNSAESKEEFGELIRAQNTPAHASRSVVNLKGFFKKLSRKDFIKPLLIILFGSIILEASGRHIFPAYATTIIEEISGSKSQSLYYTLSIDVIITVSTLSSSIFVKTMKRRTVLFSSSIAALAVLFATCFYVFLVSREVLPKENTGIPLSMLGVYFIVVNLGCTTIPYTFLGEVFPLAHRSAGSATSGIILALSLMVALKITPYLLVSIHFYGTFVVFGASLAVGLVALYYILPETKDRTLQEIEDYFNFGEFRNGEPMDEDVKKRMIV